MGITCTQLLTEASNFGSGVFPRCFTLVLQLIYRQPKEVDTISEQKLKHKGSARFK